MSEAPAFPNALFDRAGLNRQHVFALKSLPDSIKATLGETGDYTQLILLGHAGKQLWECVKAADMPGEHPIDDYTVQTIKQVFSEQFADRRYRILYPGDASVGLQQLGKLAGWHHPSPFMVGIDGEWGSWFAYRAAILANTDFLPFFPVDRGNPCLSCAKQPCISACPAAAMANGRFSLTQCISYREAKQSACQFTCLARIACPVGSAHRYDDAQLRHAYGQSLATIRRYTHEASHAKEDLTDS
jgi:epoxyqueuosine reductase